MTFKTAHVREPDGTLAYDRPDDDDLCGLCTRRAYRTFHPPRGAAVPLCAEHYRRIDGLVWPGRGRAHWRPHILEFRTACGRVPTSRLRLADDRSRVTCRSCLRVIRAAWARQVERGQGGVPLAPLRWAKGRWLPEEEAWRTARGWAPSSVRVGGRIRAVETVRVRGGVL